MYAKLAKNQDAWASSAVFMTQHIAMHLLMESTLRQTMVKSIKKQAKHLWESMLWCNFALGYKIFIQYICIKHTSHRYQLADHITRMAVW